MDTFGKQIISIQWPYRKEEASSPAGVPTTHMEQGEVVDYVEDDPNNPECTEELEACRSNVMLASYQGMDRVRGQGDCQVYVRP